MSSCFGSAQLMHIKQGTDWCLESHPHPFFFFFFKSSSQAEQPPAHLNKCTGSTTKPFILLCWRFRELHSLLLCALIPKSWSLQDLYDQFLKGKLHSILCLGTGLWRKGEKYFILFAGSIFHLVKIYFGTREKMGVFKWVNLLSILS